MSTTSTDHLSAAAIASSLRQKIDTGEWTPGHVLPAEVDGAETYGVARATYRAALRMLRTLGRIETRRGVGSIVRERPPVRLLGTGRYAAQTDDDLSAVLLVGADGAQRSVARPVVSEVQQVGADQVPGQLGQWLTVGPERWVTAVRGLLISDSGPVHIAQVYLTAQATALIDGRREPELLAGAVRRRLESAGLTHVHTREEITTRLPDAQEAKTLGMPAEMPVLVMQWAMTLTNVFASRTLAAGQVVLPGDRVIVSNVFR